MTERQIDYLSRSYEVYIERKKYTVFSRFVFTHRNIIGLSIDTYVAFAKHRRANKAKFKFRYLILSFIVFWLRKIKSRKYANKPYGVQLRSRLTNMGATYVKLGQILSLRDDIIPSTIAEELKLLFDQLPALRYERFEELVESNLKRPIWSVFSKIEKNPLGSASIAQVHKAELVNGEEVVIKLLKPGTRDLIKTDSIIIRFLGTVLQKFMPRLQPKLMLSEFCEYTNREVDFRLEANNAIEFAANFKKFSFVVFPKVYKEYSNEDLLVMEFLKGIKPDKFAAGVYTDEQKSNIADIGAFSIIKMLFHDGFFHADLHPGNLLILNEDQCGFIDLGMVGRFNEATRKNLVYYFNALVFGNSEAAARYMSLVATPGKNADIIGYRKEFSTVAESYFKSANFKEFSIGKLILTSTELGAKYGMYYPMELILMSKAMITFEGVGEIIKPGLDIVEASKKHIAKILVNELNPKDLIKASFQNAPEFLDTITRAPGLFVEIFKRIELDLNSKQNQNSNSPKRAIIAGSCIIGACIIYVSGGEPIVYGFLFLLAAILAFKS